MEFQVGDYVITRTYTTYMETEYNQGVVEKLIKLTEEEKKKFPSLIANRVLLKNVSRDRSSSIIKMIRKIFISKRTFEIYDSFPIDCATLLERSKNFKAPIFNKEEEYYSWLAKR